MAEGSAGDDGAGVWWWWGMGGVRGECLKWGLLERGGGRDEEG